ncbi:MAG: heimdallarchaeosortase [Candidatus Heimdallarchaeota archaeon]
MSYKTKQKKSEIYPTDLSENQVFLRLFIAISLVAVIYLIPSYSFMFKPIRNHVTFVLELLGVSVEKLHGNASLYGFVVVGEYYYIVKACTGMQAGAILIALIIVTPAGSKSFRKKLLAGSVLFVILYIGNVLRIAFHMLLVSKGIPFSIAHDMLSKPIGFVGTILFALTIERMGVPILDQFSIFLETLWQRGKTLLGIKSTPQAASSKKRNPSEDSHDQESES